MTAKSLGRKAPRDWDHYKKYALHDLVDITATSVEKNLKPLYPARYFDQNGYGACVGFGCQRLMSIINHELYDPYWLWNEAKKIDEWDDTNPGDNEGTSVKAGLEVLRTQGDKDTDLSQPELSAGISEYRWASTVDEVRGLIALNIPVVIGINWYTSFDSPVEKVLMTHNEYWIGEGDLGYIRGGHCVCIFGASDRRQAVKIVNSWGRDYPRVWMPYNTLQRMIDEEGEVGLVTDIPGDPDLGDWA